MKPMSSRKTTAPNELTKGLDPIRTAVVHPEDLIGTRIELQGPSLFVSAPAAQAIGMALHELATNAGKYGALSAADGHVKIQWSLSATEAGQKFFAMSWRESGGPQYQRLHGRASARL